MSKTPITALVAGTISGAVGAYLLDPDRGHSRRARAADQLRADLRRLARRTRRRVHRAESRAHGAFARVNGYGEPHPTSDHEILDLVRQNLSRLGYRHRTFSLDVVNGTATIRGVVPAAATSDLLEAAVRGVPGVVHVVNLLHEAGTPAPNKAAALMAAS